MRTGLGLGLKVGGVAPAFKPSDISGLAAWWRADLGVTGSAPVTNWADQVHGYNLVSGTSKPSLGTKNGQATIAFSSVGGTATQAMTCDTASSVILSGAVAAEMFMVTASAANPPAHQNDQWQGLGNNDNYSPYVNNLFYSTFGRQGREDAMDPGGGFDPTTLFAYNVWSAANDWAFNLNGVSLHTDSVSTFDTSGTILLGVSLYDGFVSEWIIVGRKLTSSERSKFRSYISTRYGFSA